MDIKFNLTLQNEDTNYGQVVVEPLSPGFGSTIGNSLRRVMLGYLEGASATSVKINGVDHQFGTLKGMSQDAVDFILNVKQINFVYSGDEPATVRIDQVGPKAVTAGDIDLPSGVSVANPDLVLANLSDESARLEAEIVVEKGVGYKPAEDNNSSIVGLIPVDSSFSPVIRVNFEVSSTRVGRLTNYDKLIIDVWTNGTITPMDAVQKSASILAKYFAKIASGESQEESVVSVSVEQNTEVNNKELMMLTVEELELPTRIANALRKAGYATVKEILSASEEDIIKVKNLGGKSISIIHDALRAKGVEVA